MKNILIILLLFAWTGINAQKHSPYANIRLETDKDYSDAQKSVLQAANFILSLPVNKENTSKSEAMHFLVDWMKGTPDYMFPLNEPIAKISNENPELLIIFMACMTRYVLENPGDKSPEENEINYNGFLIFSDYCNEPKNKVEIRGELKNLIKARKDGNLKDYLKEFDEKPEGKIV